MYNLESKFDYSSSLQEFHDRHFLLFNRLENLRMALRFQKELSGEASLEALIRLLRSLPDEWESKAKQFVGMNSTIELELVILAVNQDIFSLNAKKEEQNFFLKVKQIALILLKRNDNLVINVPA